MLEDELVVPSDRRHSARLSRSESRDPRSLAGQYGTTLSQTAWLPVLRTLRMQPWFEGRLMVARAGMVFNEALVLTDEQTRTRLREFVLGFVKFCSR